MKTRPALLLAILPAFWLLLSIVFSGNLYVSDAIGNAGATEFALSRELGYPPGSENFFFSAGPVRAAYFYSFTNREAHLGYSSVLVLLARLGLLFGYRGPLFPLLQLWTLLAASLSLWLAALIVYHYTKDSASGFLASLGMGCIHSFWFYAMQPKGYTFCVLAMLLCVFLHIRLRPNMASLVLTGFLFGGAVLMSITGAGLGVILVVLELVRSRRFSVFLTRIAVILLAASILTGGAYALDALRDPAVPRTIPGISSGVLNNLAGIVTAPKVSATHRMTVGERVKAFYDYCRNGAILSSSSGDPEGLLKRLSILIMALAAAGITASLSLNLVKRQPLGAWLFPMAWTAVFSMELILVDPLNDFAYLGLIGAAMLAAASSRQLPPVGMYFLILFAFLGSLNFLLSILPMHDKTNAVYSPEKERLASLIKPQDMLISDVQSENIEIVYAGRMLSVNMDEFLQAPLEEDATIRALREYAAGHRIYYVPIDRILLSGREREMNRLEVFFRRNFRVREAFAYPLRGGTPRIYREILP
jgi:hypothetical protein